MPKHDAPACLIAAGGTAGHVLPALAVGEALRDRGARVTFAGSPRRAEARLVPEAGFELDTFRVSGLPRRPGLAQAHAVLHALAAPAACDRILARRKPDVVLGAGGPAVLHASGERDYESLRPRVSRPDYVLVPVLDGLGAAYGAADLALMRSGSTVWELAAAGLPAVLVPYPFASADHQTKNARYFQTAGGAILVPETELGHDAANVPDGAEVIVSSAITPDNPEVAGRDVRRRGELLAELVELRPSIVVAGAHGKTTTAGMIAFCLDRLGSDPTFLIGGAVPQLGGNARAGDGGP